MRPQEGHIGCPRKRGLPGQALVQHAGERVQVGARLDVVAGDLLRSDVLERADDITSGGDAAERAGPLGQPEVGEVAVLLARSARDQHVRRLHVPVHEPLLVSRVQRLRDLLEQRNRAARLERALRREQLPEIGALDVAHREKEGTVHPPRRRRSARRGDGRAKRRRATRAGTARGNGGPPPAPERSPSAPPSAPSPAREHDRPRPSRPGR